MVHFKKNVLPRGDEYLVILDDEHQDLKGGTQLKVEIVLLPPYAKPWPHLTCPRPLENWSKKNVNKTSIRWVLQNTHHQESTIPSVFSTLGRRIIDGAAQWEAGANAIDFSGEFHYFKGYWEWTEDILSRCKNALTKANITDAVHASLFTYDRNVEIVKAFCEAWSPKTNTLLTSCGELSISLWDLHHLSGLPILGKLYDEVVPSAEELIEVDATGQLYLPRSCKFLFHAFHLLRGRAKGNRHTSVSIEDWIQFWSKKEIRYAKVPP